MILVTHRGSRPLWGRLSSLNLSTHLIIRIAYLMLTGFVTRVTAAEADYIYENAT